MLPELPAEMGLLADRVRHRPRVARRPARSATLRRRRPVRGAGRPRARRRPERSSPRCCARGSRSGCPVRQPVGEAELPPDVGDAGPQHETLSVLHAQAEHRLERDAQHPARGAGVPGPAAAPDVGRHRVDVGRHHVGLHLVDRDVFGCPRMVRRQDHLEQCERALAPAERRDRAHGPGRGVRVLPAVLADTGHVALDVAGRRVAACRRAARAAGSAVPRAAPARARARPSPARSARAASPPESTAHACGSTSMRHSRPCAVPSGVPSSK